ncbi:MAG: radical SAM protein, partial [Candidatus Hodarchaeota archaeon]
MKYFDYGTNMVDKIFQVGGPHNWGKKVRQRWPWLFALEKSPTSLGIEVTNACNLRCIMCHRQAMNREVGFMNLDLFKECAHQGIEMGVKMIVPFNYGEALLHPNLVDMVEYIKAQSKETMVKINTNGMLLTKEYARALVRAGIDEIT